MKLFAHWHRYKQLSTFVLFDRACIRACTARNRRISVSRSENGDWTRKIDTDSFRFSFLYSTTSCISSIFPTDNVFSDFSPYEHRVTRSLYPSLPLPLSFSLHPLFYARLFLLLLTCFPSCSHFLWISSRLENLSATAESREIEFSAPLVKWNSISISNTVEPRLKKDDRSPTKERETASGGVAG